MADIDDVINNPINAEDFKSEDLPEDGEKEASLDPEDVDLEDDIDIGDEEIDPMGDDVLGGGLEDDEFSDELEDDSLFGEPEMVAPEEQVKWTTVQQENGDIWSEHESGFVLRARPLSTKQGSKLKYSAQLFKNNKMVDKGTIWVEKGADATEFLQNVADRILDRHGLVNYSNQEAEPAEPAADEELDLGGDDELDLGGDEELDLGGDEELDLGDDELDLGEEEDEDELSF